MLYHPSPLNLAYYCLFQQFLHSCISPFLFWRKQFSIFTFIPTNGFLTIPFFMSLTDYSAFNSEKAMATHSSTLAWKIPWMEEPGRLQSVGLWRVGHDWVTSLSLFTFMHWRRKWQLTPVFLPEESQGRQSLVGCCLWGCRVGHDWSNLAAATFNWWLSYVPLTLHSVTFHCFFTRYWEAWNN